MNHIVVILSVVSAILGVSAWMVLYQQYRRYKLVEISKYLFYLGFEVGFILFTLGYFYIWMNVVTIPPGIRTVISLLSPSISLVATLLYVEFAKVFLKRKTWILLWRITIVIATIVFLARINKALLADVMPNQLFDFLASNLVLTTIMLLFALTTNLLLLLTSARQKVQRKRKYLFLFSLIHLISTLLWAIVLVTRWFDFVDRTTFLSSQYLISILFYISVLIFASRFIAGFFVAGATDESLQHIFDEMVIRYSISSREKEIVELICRGKTNQQIADALFIALSTVKEHITHIYKKTGVSNRVSLTNLFTQPN